MAIDTQIHTVYDGEMNASIQIIGKSDGTGNEIKVVKVDVSELLPPCSSVRVNKIVYDVDGGIVTLSWDDLTPLPFAYLRGHDEISYRREAGFNNLADPQSRSGDILLTTNDFDPDGFYTILLECRKKFS